MRTEKPTTAGWGLLARFLEALRRSLGAMAV